MVKFRYYENDELDINQVYLQKDYNGVMSFVKLTLYKGDFYTNHPLEYKAKTIKMVPFEDILYHQVQGYNDNGVFTGRLTSINLPIGEFKHKDSCFIFWEGQQKNKPMGWNNINHLKFI